MKMGKIFYLLIKNIKYNYYIEVMMGIKIGFFQIRIMKKNVKS